MDKIPLEVLLNILDGLTAPLARYASVCRAFQRVIEARTFAEIQMTSTEQSLNQFDAIFANTRRRCLVRDLEYKVKLPETNNKRLGNSQSNHGVAKNNTIYTIAVSALFTRLQEWTNVSDNLETAPSFRLTISYSSPKDDDRPKSHGRCQAARNRFRYIDFDGLGVLPPLLCVNNFRLVGRDLHPNVIAVISKALPRMNYLNCSLRAALRRLGALRAELRASMTSVLAETNFPNLEALNIYHEDYDPLNQD
ncbi:mRNA splicing protein [Hypoxylon texense]